MARQSFPSSIFETPEQARQRTSLRADLADSTSLVDFLGTLIGRGVQAARGQGPQKRAVQDAEQVQAALQRAMSAAGFESAQPGSAMDASNQFLINAVRELNQIGRPDLALQFADRIAAAEQDRAAVRSALLEADIAEEKLGAARDVRAATTFGLRDPETGEIIGPFRLSDEADRREMLQRAREARMQGRTLLPASSEELLKLSSAEQIALARLKQEAKSGRALGMTTAYNRFIEAGQDSMAALRAITDTATIVRNNLSFAPTTIGETLRSAVNTLGFHVRSLFSIDPDVQEQQEQFARDNIFRLSGTRDAQFTSAATNLAYAIAAARKSGRLNVQDVELAVETVGAAQKDPKILLGVLRMLARQMLEGAQDRFLGLEGVEAAETVMGGVFDRYAAALDAIGEDAVDLANPEEALRVARQINREGPTQPSPATTDPRLMPGWDELSPAEQEELLRLTGHAPTRRRGRDPNTGRFDADLADIDKLMGR